MLPTLIRRPGPASIAAAVLLSAYFAIGLNSAMQQSVSYDEPAHWRYGVRVASGDTSRFDDSKMPVTALNTVPALIKRAWWPQVSWSIPQTFRSGRVITLIAAALLGWLVFVWARSIAGSAAGLMSLGIFVLDPNLAAHSQFVTTDIYGALGITLSVWLFWRFLEKPGTARAALSGLAFGGALLCKFTSVYLVILFPILAVIHRTVTGPKDGRRTGPFKMSALFILMGVLSLAVLAAGYLGNGWGASLRDYDFKSDLFIGLTDMGSVLSGIPLPFPKPFIEGLDWVKFYEHSAIGRGPAYLFGRISTDPFAGYYAWVFLFKVPLSIQALLVWVTIEWAVVRRTKPSALLIPLVTALFFLGYFVFFCSAQMGVRMLLPAFPALYVFAGCAGSGMFLPKDGDRKTGDGRGQAVRTGALALLAFWCAVSVGTHYPHLLGYFNELAGKPTRYYRILADSNLEWGNNLDFAKEYTLSHPEIQGDPRNPRPGKLLMSANFVVGIVKSSEFAWTRWLVANKEPVDHVGYGYLVYDLTEEDVRAIRLAMEEKS